MNFWKSVSFFKKCHLCWLINISVICVPIFIYWCIELLQAHASLLVYIYCWWNVVFWEVIYLQPVYLKMTKHAVHNPLKWNWIGVEETYDFLRKLHESALLLKIKRSEKDNDKRIDRKLSHPNILVAYQVSTWNKKTSCPLSTILFLHFVLVFWWTIPNLCI